MRHHRLVRFSRNSGHGTFGRFEKWVTVEDDYPGPAIEPGTYICRRTTFHRGGYETFEVTGVPGRSRILWHIANVEEDVKGCIGPGMRLGLLWEDEDEDTGEQGYKLAVLDSGQAFQEFMEFFNGVDEWVLTVEDYEP